MNNMSKDKLFLEWDGKSDSSSEDEVVKEEDVSVFTKEYKYQGKVYSRKPRITPTQKISQKFEALKN
jgi:hypothetical protein